MVLKCLFQIAIPEFLFGINVLDFRAYLLDVPINKVVETSIAVMFTVTQVLKYLAEKKFVANEHWKYKKK